MQPKKTSSKNRFRLICKNRLRWQKINHKSLAFLLLLLACSFVLPFFSGLYAQNVVEDEVRVNWVVEPLLDKYGQPAINEDGTFYPCDQFKITYNTELANEVDFEGVEVSYDSAVFNMFDSADFNSKDGVCYFEIVPSAVAGTYNIYLTACGSCVVGNETVRYEAAAIVSIQVVAYDPHFTATLAYTIPTGNGSSYDMPFALIIRYEGNGPNYNLYQRAIIDDYTWVGYAQKMPEMDNMAQTFPDFTVSIFFNQTSNTQFLIQGIDTKISQAVLIVDDQSFTTDELPKAFFWEKNTNHTYTWTKNLQVNKYEWFEWQASLLFPPQINPNLTNQTATQEDLQNQLLDQINSPNGTLTTTPFGNTVTAMYTHNKDLAQIAKDTGVSKNQTLTNLNATPTYFTSQQRYAKLQYQLNPTVAKELVNQNFTNTLHYNLTVGCELFGASRFFETNFTCEYEFFTKPINATAYKWDPTLQKWSIDNTITIDTTFESALNITTTDILRSNLEEQTTDQAALQMALKDLYDSDSQRFTGTGTLNANLKRTSPLYYNLQIIAGNQQKTTLLQKTIQINFQTNNPYHLPLNFDPDTPLQITTLSDTPQNTILQLDAPKELAGLTNITIYQITNLPNENTNNLQKNQLNLKPIKTVELTLPQEQVQMPPEHEQFHQYYTGYSTVLEDILGFQGQTQIPIQKNKSITTLTQQGEALLYVEATNVWDTTFHQIIHVQPYTTPKWEIPLNEATTYLVTIIVITILVSFITYLIRTKQ